MPSYIKAFLIDFQLHRRGWGGRYQTLNSIFHSWANHVLFQQWAEKSWFSGAAAGVIDRDPAKVTPRGNAGSWIPTLPEGAWTIYRTFFFFLPQWVWKWIQYLRKSKAVLTPRVRGIAKDKWSWVLALRLILCVRWGEKSSENLNNHIGIRELSVDYPLPQKCHKQRIEIH